MNELNAIIDKINAQLDAEAFARLLDYHPEKIQVSGTNVKCFCPVHKEMAFRSLILDQREKSYRCTMKHCPAFAGGPLIQLWALKHDLELVEAAIDLSEKLKLDIDLETLKGLSGQFMDKARQALEEGDLATADEAIAQMLSIQPRALDARLMQAEVAEARGNAEEALALRIKIVEDLSEERLYAEARPLLELLIKANPDSLELAKLDLNLAYSEGDNTLIELTLERLAELQRARGVVEDEVVTLEELLERRPKEPELIERLAVLYGEQQRGAEQLKLLERLVSLQRESSDLDALTATLEKCIRLAPERTELRMELAEAYHQKGEETLAKSAMRAVLELQTEAGDYEKAIETLERLLAVDPEDSALLERRAMLLANSGQAEAAIESLCELARRAREGKDHQAAIRYFERARTIAPDSPVLLAEQAETRIDGGDLEGGINDLFALATANFEADEADKGEEILQRIAGLAPRDLNRRLRIAGMLERNARLDQAYSAYIHLTRDLLSEDRNDSALAVCQELMRMRPLEMQTLELNIEVYLALDQKPEAIDLCRKAATDLIGQKNLSAAETLLQRAIKIDRTQLQVKADLAALYEKQDRKEDSALLWVEMATFQRAEGESEEAVLSARKAFELADDNLQVRICLAESLEAAGLTDEAQQMWKQIGTGLASGEGDAGDALETLKHALELSPRDLELLAVVARLSHEQLGADEALPCYERWLEMVNLEADAPRRLDAYRQCVEQYPDASAWRQRFAGLLEEDAQPAMAAEHYAKLLKECKTDDEKLDLLECLVRTQPERLEWQEAQAETLLATGHTSQAVTQWQKLAEAFLAQGDQERGCELLMRALEYTPADEELLTQTAELHERHGREDEAVALYERLIELHRKGSDQTLNIPIIEKVLVHDPAREALRSELAALYELDGDIDHAVEHHFRLAQDCGKAKKNAANQVAICEKIRELAPSFTAAREMLVDGLVKLKEVPRAKQELDALGDWALGEDRPEQAEQYFKRILEIDPEDIAGGERLGKLYEARQMPEQAAEAYEQVLNAYERQGEHVRAGSVLGKLCGLRPTDSTLVRRLAENQVDNGKLREAAESWMKWVQLGIGNGERDVVLDELENLTELFRKDWDWREQLAKLLSEHGDAEEARAQWQAIAEDALAEKSFELAYNAASCGLELDAEDDALRESRISAARSLSRYEQATDDLKHLAHKAIAAEAYEMAEVYLKRALELSPKSVELAQLLADVQVDHGQREEANHTLERLVELYRNSDDPESAIGTARRIVELNDQSDASRNDLVDLLKDLGRTEEAMAVWREMAEESAAAGKLDDALKRLARILDHLPGNIDILRRQADLIYDNGGMLEAMSYYDRLIDALHNEGDHEAIVGEYERILELESGHLQLKERYAKYLHEQGETEQALGMLGEIVATWRDEREQYDEAIRVLRELKHLSPEDLAIFEQEADLLDKAGRSGEAANVWRQIAGLHRREGSMEQTAECLAKAASLDPDNAEIQMEVAELFEQTDAPDRAIEFLLKAIDIYDRTEDYKSTAVALTKATQLAPERLEFQDALARMYERLDELKKARDQWLALGERHEELGQSDEAIEVYTHLQALLPNDQKSRRLLVRLHRENGNNIAAARYLRELASFALENGNEQAAAEHLTEVLDLQPSDEEAAVQLAGLWRKLEKHEELYAILSRLEQIYSGDGRLEQAVEALNEMKSLRPDDPELMSRSIDMLLKTDKAAQAAQLGFELIQVYFDNNEDERALDTLRRIAEYEPDNVDRRIALARLIHDKGRPEQAMQEFFLAASTLFGDGAFEATLDVCRAGVELFDDDVRLRDLMGRTLLKLDRHEEATQAQLYLAVIYDGRGEESKAERVYNQILEDQPDHKATLEAVIEWAIRHEKTNVAVDHLMHLAETFYVTGELKAAQERMEEIARLAPERLELRARLAEIYLEDGEQDKGIATLKAIAENAMEQGQARQALTHYQRLVDLAPDQIELREALLECLLETDEKSEYLEQGLALAETYRKDKRDADALALLRKLSNAGPVNLALWEQIASLCQAQNDQAGAVEALIKQYEIHQADHKLEAARAALDAALEIDQSNVDLMIAQGDLCLTMSLRPQGLETLGRAARKLRELQRDEEAAELVARLIKLDPSDRQTRLLWAETLEALGRNDEAQEAYTQAARQFADAHETETALHTLAHLLTLNHKRDDDRELYAKLLGRNGRAEESIEQYITLVRGLESSADPRQTIKYCRSILAIDESNAEAHIQLCSIYEKTEKNHQALQECEWLSEHFLAKNDLDKAENYILKGIELDSSDLGMLRRHVDLLIAAGRNSAAGERLAELAKRAEERNDIQTTGWATRKACEIEPKNIAFRESLVEFLERNGEVNEARTERVTIIELMLEEGRMSEARERADQLVETAPENDEMRLHIADIFERAGLPEVSAYHYHYLARRALGREEMDQAANFCNRALELKPRHTAARETLIEALLATGNKSGAVEQYNALYRIYDESGDIESAIKNLQSIITLMPSDPNPRQMFVELLTRMHRTDEIIEQLRKLAEIYVNAGDVEQAINALRQLISERPDDTQARVRYIDLYEQMGDDSELIDDYIRLAQIFARKGEVVEATRTYEKILIQQPEVAACREEFIHFLFEQGQVSRALDETRELLAQYEKAGDDANLSRALDRALNYAPEELDLRETLAKVYIRSNKRGLALETFRSLAHQYEQEKNDVKLVDVLRQIIAIDELNIEYRQQFVTLLHKQSNHEEAVSQHLVLADQYSERGLHDLAEREYRRVIELQPERGEIWQKIVDTHLHIGTIDEIVPDLIMLAELQLGNGQLKEAIRTYRRILDVEPDNIEVLRNYIDTYSQIGLEQDLIEDYLHLAELYRAQNEMGDAIGIYKHLMDLNPEDPTVKRELHATQQVAERMRLDGTYVGTGKHDSFRRVRQTGTGTGAAGTPAPDLSDSQICKQIENYQNILKLNPRNPNIQVKIAQLFERQERQDEADRHWPLAANGFFDRGELEKGIEIATEYLDRNPDDADVRLRLNQARLQRDSMRTIDNAIDNI